VAKIYKELFGYFFMENGKINDLIFKELIKRGYSLRGKTRVWNIADSKLLYLTPEQAQAYLDRDESPQYQKNINLNAKALIEKNISKILERVENGPLNIIDLGCGDGKKACHIINYFKEKAKIRYCPIDISGYMVNKAVETMKEMPVSEIIEFKYNISDFDNLENLTPLLTKGDYEKNLFLLLGNTLGNFEIHELLYEIRSSMKNGDLLLIGTGVDDRKGNLLANAEKDNPRTRAWLDLVVRLIGLSEDEAELDSRFVNHRIERFYVIKKDKTIKFFDKKVELRAGDEIIVLVAYKYGIDHLKSYLNMHFDQVEVEVSSDNTSALCFCSKGLA
jgi:uncharacterized SAM-dependent methyltransferase